MGFASTRAEARQLVSHGCVLVNGKTVNIPSYLVAFDANVEIKEKSKKQLRVLAAIEKAGQVGFPEWVDVNAKDLKGTYKTAPGLSDMPDININLVVEYYSQ
jgi:small subunit ribosomal protein S4